MVVQRNNKMTQIKQDRLFNALYAWKGYTMNFNNRTKFLKIMKYNTYNKIKHIPYLIHCIFLTTPTQVTRPTHDKNERIWVVKCITHMSIITRDENL